MPSKVLRRRATSSPIAWALPRLALPTAMLLSGCGENGASTVKAVSLNPICERALRVVCISSEDLLTPGTAQSIVRTNEAIAEGCRNVPQAVQCPRGTKPRVVPPSILGPEKATS
jgi:hypothetical protein